MIRHHASSMRSFASQFATISDYFTKIYRPADDAKSFVPSSISALASTFCLSQSQASPLILEFLAFGHLMIKNCSYFSLSDADLR